jgi:hypothetical protein
LPFFSGLIQHTEQSGINRRYSYEKPDWLGFTKQPDIISKILVISYPGLTCRTMCDEQHGVLTKNMQPDKFDTKAGHFFP